ncbi:MAG: DUF1761 domain-containing protein [Flavobacteriaceae bacterium]|nr:DUF1761 domain-containing protein [Flavobacteriaceae bacterium]
MENINWLALVVAALSTLVVGFVWYHPKVFGTIWMKEIGMTEEKAKKGNMALIFSVSVILAFFVSFFIMMLVFSGGSPEHPHGAEPFMTFKHGALHGTMLGLFVILPVIVTNGLFEQRSFKYMMIITGYWVVSFAIMGGIINAWT